MKPLSQIAEHNKITPMTIGDGFIFGTIRFNNGEYASIVVGENEDGKYDHVSVAPYNQRKTPTWEQMCEVKDVCWNDDEEAYEIHPPKSEYVNIKENCLHILAMHDGTRFFD